MPSGPLHEDEGELSQLGKGPRGDAAGAADPLRRLAGAGVVGILLIDLHGRVLDANAEFLQMLGYTREDLRSGRLRWDDITPPEWRGVDEAITRALMDTGEAKPVEKEYYHKGGHRVPVLVGGALLSRETTETVAFVVDLTRQREAEAELRLRSELLDLSYDAIVVWGIDERGAQPIRLWNCGAEALYGYTKREAIGQESHRLLQTKPVGTTISSVERAVWERGEWTGELTHVTRAGDEVVVDARLQLLRRVARTPLVLETNRDITARRRAEARAFEANAWLAAIVEGSQDAIISKQLDGTITSWNAAAERLLGYTRDEIVGKSVLTIVPNERHAEEEEILSRLARGERIHHFETVRVRKDGTRFAVALTVSPVCDASGQVIGASKILRDVSAEQVARERADEARRAAEAASHAKSNFIASMSHELRTPLNAVLGYADLLQDGVAGPLNDKQRDYVQRTREAGRMLLALVNDVLDLAQIEAGKTRTQEEVGLVRPVVHAAVALVEPQARARSIELIEACRTDSAFRGDVDRVQQIVTNLLANAVKFTNASGRITITCATSRHGPGAEALDAEGDPADSADVTQWTVIRIHDTGIGIPADALQRIFEPFEQADVGFNRSQSGAGLGLAISRELARLMGGDVTVLSVVGEGSTFFLYLPSAPASEVLPERRERRGPGRYLRGMSIVSDAALSEIEHILRGYARRLRTDPETPSARSASEAEIDDHGAAFIADLARTLLLIEGAAGESSQLLRDGVAIQREIAERHGVLRAHLGWSAAEVRREFEILRDEIDSATRRRLRELSAEREPTEGSTLPVDEALSIIARFVERAERTALEAHARQNISRPRGRVD